MRSIDIIDTAHLQYKSNRKYTVIQMTRAILPPPRYSAEQLFELLNDPAMGWDEIQEQIDYCFEPWFNAVRSGQFKTAGIKKKQTELGYTATFDKLTKALKLTDHNSNQSGSGKGLTRYYAGRTLYTQKLEAAAEAAPKQAGKGEKKNVALERMKQGKKPIDVERYIAIAARLLRSSDPCDIAVGLMAATGRRSIEICYIGKFSGFKPEQCPEWMPVGNPAYMLSFANPAKKRDWDLPEDEKASFVIPTLFPVDAVLKAWKKLKASAEYKAWQSEAKTIIKAKGEKEARQKFHAIWESKLNQAVEAAFPVEVLPPKDSEGKKPTCHCFRGAYAELMQQRENRDEAIAPLLYISSIMGHYIESKDSQNIGKLQSSLSYLVYKAKGDVPFAASPLVNPSKSIHVYESEKDWLVEQQRLLKLSNQGDALAMIRQKLHRLDAIERELQAERSERAVVEAKLNELQTAAEPITESLKALQAENQQLRAKLTLKGATDKPVELPEPVKVKPTVLKAVEPEPEITDRRRKTSDETQEWIGQVFEAISDFNDAQSGDKWSKWGVTARALKDISRCHQDAVKRWVSENQARIDEMHDRHGLKPSHNNSKARKGLGNVAEAFSHLQRPTGLMNAAVKLSAA